MSESAEISFFVPGTAQPGGSKRAFYVEKLHRAVVSDDNAKVKDWRRTLAYFARKAYQGPLLADALEVDVIFVRLRPKGHYGTGKNASVLKPSAPSFPTTKPDTTKLWRAAEDALTAVLWKDDAQIVKQTIRKEYGDAPGMWITVRKMPEPTPSGAPERAASGRRSPEPCVAPWPRGAIGASAPPAPSSLFSTQSPSCR